jgi:hypothetical protein
MGNELKRGKLLKRAGLVILMGACAMLLSASQASAKLIDHFTDTEAATLDFNTGGTGSDCVTVTVLETGLSGVLGARRETTLMRDHDGSGGFTRVFLDPVDAHVLFWSNDANVVGELTLRYDGMTALDYTEGGVANAVAFNLKHTDLNAICDITVESTANGNGMATVNMPGGAGDVFFVVPFLSFTNASAFESMDAIVFRFYTADVADVDLSIDAIEQTYIPEPLTMLGMVFGLGGVGAYIRKRRMA